MNQTELRERIRTDRTGYDPTTETYFHRHEWDGDRGLATSIVEAVAAVSDTAPLSADPLYDSVDPDALERYLRSVRSPDQRVGGTAQFTVHGYAVTVGSNGHIAVQCSPDEHSIGE